MHGRVEHPVQPDYSSSLVQLVLVATSPRYLDHRFHPFLIRHASPISESSCAETPGHALAPGLLLGYVRLMSRPLVVGIAGGTASGKTTVTRKVHQALGAYRVVFLDQDSYYRDLSEIPLSKRREVNFDHPDAFDTDLLVRHLRELKAGRRIDKPVYNFLSST